ncbi:MAG TPA: alpha/beta fold hydrolase [Chryseosolibacter sp.]|nr:alpha/beta fold hydrolase [Chryseosolibacter sp.]
MQEFTYIPPRWLFNAHLETIYPALFRKVNLIAYSRERITTPDHDFLDLDWLKQGSKKLVIIQHGLEGNTTRAYIKGMAKTFFDNGFDVLTWNYRGCSEEMNRLLRFYHSGATEDLGAVVSHARTQDYNSIYLVGFSLGGNLTLKYLGESTADPIIRKAIVFSVPLDLESSCKKISHWSNKIYAQRFITSLKNKVLTKSLLMPGLETRHLRTIKTLMDFDDAYTAPLHGFENAADYYHKNSSINFLNRITISTLIVNTTNDPFLSKACLPVELLKDNPHVKMEVYNKGGHVGFTQVNPTGIYWSEQRALNWITSDTP